MNCIDKVKSEDKDHEECEEKSLGAYVPQLPLHGCHEKERPEEWEPKEEPEEWPEEWSSDDSEGKKDEWAIEEEEGEPEEWSAEESTKDLNNEHKDEPREWSVEEQVEAAPKFGSKTVSDGIVAHYEQPLGDPDDPSGKYPSEPAPESDNEAVPQPKSVAATYNEKKRSRNASPDESAILSVNQAQKKHRQEESPKPSLGIGSSLANIQSKPGVLEGVICAQEHTGSSGKRRRSESEDDTSRKKKKTKWDDDGSQLKILGPVQLPDFRKCPVCDSDIELEIIELKAKLIAINCKLQESELQDDRPENERSPSPEPVYNHLGIRINTRESRLRVKLIEERQCIISSLIHKNPTFKLPSEDKPSKLYKKLYIPVKEYPGYNFVGPIIGPRGNTQRRMQKETGAKIQVRGKGASRMQQEHVTSSTEDLHVYIEADNLASLDAAVALVEKLLIPFNNEVNEHKLAQFKELAHLNGSDGGKSLGKVHGEEGHKHKICPSMCSSTPLPSNIYAGSEAFSLGHALSSTPFLEIKPKANLYVANLPQALEDCRLKELFSPYGKVISARVIKDRTTGVGKGYGFVQFESSDDAAMAVMHMDGYKLYGRILAVRVAGHPPVASHLLPAFPWPATFSPDIQSQEWLYPPPAYCYPNNAGVDFSSLAPNCEAVGQPLPEISTDSSYESSCLYFPSYAFHNQVPPASPASSSQISGHSDCDGFQYSPYLATAVLEGSWEQFADQPLGSKSKGLRG